MHVLLSDISLFSFSFFLQELPCFQEVLTSQIKAIKFMLFRGKKSEMRIVEYFLKHARVLENLIVHMMNGRNAKFFFFV